jgi:hypothetical protein
MRDGAQPDHGDGPSVEEQIRKEWDPKRQGGLPNLGKAPIRDELADRGLRDHRQPTPPALVSRGGSIDWLCLPRFDSESVFGALLGEPQHGRWLIEPACEVVRRSRRYRGDTGILETAVRDGRGLRHAD